MEGTSGEGAHWGRSCGWATVPGRVERGDTPQAHDCDVREGRGRGLGNVVSALLSLPRVAATCSHLPTHSLAEGCLL